MRERAARKGSRCLYRFRSRFPSLGRRSRPSHPKKIKTRPPPTNPQKDYDKKKYVWKLLYIHMLGYDVEFGHRQAADLLAAPRYAEKQVGYLACSLLLSERDEFLRLVTNSVRSDLVSRNEAFQALALTFLANVGGAEMASLLAPDAAAVLLDGGARPGIRGRAALALLRAARKSLAQDEDPLPADAWAPRLAALLDDEKDVGLLLCVSALVVGVVARSYAGFECLAPRLVALLARLRARDVPPDCTYYGIACPWAQVKVLRALQYFPPPDAPTRRSASAALRSAIDAAAAVWGPSASSSSSSSSSSASASGQPAAAQPPKNVNKSNALHAIALEAAPLALGGWGDDETAAAAAALLAKCALGGSSGGRGAGIRDANVRCLGLDALARLGGLPAAAAAAAAARPALAEALRDNDTSIRRRALDLLFSQADAAAAPSPSDRGSGNGGSSPPSSSSPAPACGGVAAFEQLLAYLSPGGGCAPDMREEVALRAAVLAERFAPDSSWYARSLLALVEAAGEDAPPDVWRSAAHVVAAADAGGRAAAAGAALAALRRSRSRGGGRSGGGGGGAPDPLVCAAAFLVGEYGRLVAGETPAAEQFALLRDCLAGAGRAAKGMLLTALLKVEVAARAAGAAAAGSPSPLAGELDLVLCRYASSADPDLQQRAVEYRGLAARPEVAARDVGPQLPPWEQRRSGLLRRMAAGGGSAAAVAAASGGGGQGASSESAFAAGAGVESDEVAVAPAWLAEDAAANASRSASGSAAAATPVAASAAAAEDTTGDFFSVASGDGRGAAAPAAAAAARDPLEDLLSLDVPADGAAPTGAAAAPAAAAAAPAAAAAAPAAAAPSAPSADPFAADPFSAAAAAAPVAGAAAFAAAPSSQAAAAAATPEAAAAPPAASAVVSVVAPPFRAKSPSPSPSSPAPARIVAKEPDAAAAAARALKLSCSSSSSSSSGPGAAARNNSGVLFEDARVQVGVRCAFDAATATGTLALFVGNKSATAAMGSLRLELPSSSSAQGIEVVFADAAAAAAALPLSVGPKQQVQLPLLKARCVGAYSAAPRATLVFSSSTSTSEAPHQIETAIELLLPLAPTKFASPPAAPLARDAFFARWRSLASPPQRVALRVERSSPLPAEAVDAALRDIGLGVQPGLDPEPANAAAAGSFAHHDANASPSLVRVPVMARVEVEASTRRQAQVTVACPEAALAGGLLDLLARLLKVE